MKELTKQRSNSNSEYDLSSYYKLNTLEYIREGLEALKFELKPKFLYSPIGKAIIYL
jgi:hypothetical protein